MAGIIEQLDALIADTLSAWNIYTTLIALALFAFVAYPLVFWAEPDTHPLLLARQAAASPVRQPRESAVYRSTEVPHGYALKTGLSVREPGAPKWTAGRDGDLRDVWREAVSSSSKATILSIHGNDSHFEHDFTQLSKSINIIGSHLQKAGIQQVAIYSPNSVEYIVTIFACSFYGLTPILVPFNQDHAVVCKLLEQTQAQAVVATAGSLPLAGLTDTVSSLRHVIWVTDSANKHMDWQGAPADETRGKLDVSVWDNLLAEASSTSSELPKNDETVVPGNLIFLWQKASNSPAEVVEFTQKNMVAAVAALISALPLRQRLGPSDLFLPADSFSHSYVLSLTLAALFSHSSLAINSVASSGVDLALASRGVSPTVIIASSQSLANLHQTHMSGASSGLQKFLHSNHGRALAAGRMPGEDLLSRLSAPKISAIGTSPGKLRLILASERAGTETATLSSATLRDLRIITRSRICYALTAPSVAGAVAQTNIYDYRHDDRPGHSHFGAPLSSVEVKLVDKDDSKVDGTTPSGEIVVSGPAVVGGESNLGVRGVFREDCTLGYA
ncbi:acetyl-CoA synthetase-like protein [Aureobasidium sp. EXF-10727]|nr:acetyl-CoA synthetase-like protein [Aureobasidium sp. EXF-10727]KAI4731951.1 acetyl-CoA synthetase-like protein [Aureobasidium sp. EXF-10728]